MSNENVCVCVRVCACIMSYSKGKGEGGGTLAELSEELAMTEWRRMDDGNSGTPEFPGCSFFSYHFVLSSLFPELSSLIVCDEQ